MLKSIKRIIVSIIISILMFTIFGCKTNKTYDNIKEITHSEIFTIDQDVYYIYVYRPNCEICANLEAEVYQFYRTSKHNSSIPDLFVINKGDGEKNAGIYCDNHDFCNDFVGASTPEGVRTSSSPLLFKVRDGKVVKICETKDTIREELNNWLS